jgi:hypothetical protein
MHAGQRRMAKAYLAAERVGLAGAVPLDHGRRRQPRRQDARPVHHHPALVRLPDGPGAAADSTDRGRGHPLGPAAVPLVALRRRAGAGGAGLQRDYDDPRGVHPAQKRAARGRRHPRRAGEDRHDQDGPKERGEYAWIKSQRPSRRRRGPLPVSTKAKALSAPSARTCTACPSMRPGWRRTSITSSTRCCTPGASGPAASSSSSRRRRPRRATEFEDLWYTGDPEDPFREARRFSMRMSTRDNIGYGIDRRLRRDGRGHAEDWIKQNIDGYVHPGGDRLVQLEPIGRRGVRRTRLPEEEPAVGAWSTSTPSTRA